MLIPGLFGILLGVALAVTANLAGATTSRIAQAAVLSPLIYWLATYFLVTEVANRLIKNAFGSLESIQALMVSALLWLAFAVFFYFIFRAVLMGDLRREAEAETEEDALQR